MINLNQNSESILSNKSKQLLIEMPSIEESTMNIQQKHFCIHLATGPLYYS